MKRSLQLLATVALIASLLAVAALLRAARGPAVVSAGELRLSAPAEPYGPLDWLAIGAAASPSGTQVSIEADLELAARTLGGQGRVLFSGGSDASCVQVRDARQRRDGLRQRLGAFFEPRAGRRAHYRRPRLPAAPATFPGVLGALRRELASGVARPLTVFVAGHGEQGGAAADNRILLWGGEDLTVSALADLLDAPRVRRPVHLVITTCFSGGFGELAFARADVDGGVPRAPRCGLFAATRDLESTGCDADPDRRRHQGYATFFFAALRGRARDGTPLARREIDFDGDGRVSLLEAHTRVRIASRTADVPTTTAERWLRVVAPEAGPRRPVELPEERAVVRALGRALDLPEPMTLALAARERAVRADDEARAAVDTAQSREDAAWHALASEALGRWPVLDDPWHPDFEATLRANRASIKALFATSPAWRRFEAARARTDARLAARDGSRRRAALHERLLRAVRTIVFAERLAALHDEDWLYWRQLLRCERFVPALRSR